MNVLIRSTIVVVVLVPLALCVLGTRLACNSTEVRTLIREVHRNEELEQSRGTIFHRIDAREETVRELMAQRCSLSHALARFGELDGEWPDHIKGLSRKHFWNDAEKNYQYIVAIAKSLLENQPEEAAAVLHRLEKDYQQLRADGQNHR